MADDNNVNPMQANLGLGASQGPVGMPTPTPADTALRLTQQATAQLQHAQQMMGANAGAAQAFGQQFRQQFQSIQAQQSMSPYAAQLMAQQMPGSAQYQGGMMPSPLTMTPATTGVFRPPPQAPTFSPVPPMYVPRQDWSPFTSQMPQPMFRTPFEQMSMAEDIYADRSAAMQSQVPRFAAQAAVFGGGAWAGRQLAQRFGMRGRMGMVGMAAGALAMGASGIAEGVGNIADFSMRPFRQRQQMGVAMQRMSQDFVVTGPQLHPMGRGLTRDASVQFGQEIQDLAGDSGFQGQTGGMFNQHDLMNITKLGGRAGLFDMAQSVPQIKQQLRTTATTIRQFMELTNDPNVANVIRQMGQLRQFGMTQQEMVEAAQGMRTFARAAGTTISGVQQMGGLPGAMTYQQAGLTPGQGFRYGNFAAASARQLVAGGGVSPRQLALLGGVSGIAQRDIQAQAALGSMPLFGAAMSQYGPGGWGVNAGAVGQSGGGAFGMVHGALGAMNQAVQQGGLGALATFPLRQREIQDQALSMMTPQEQMAQRFSMAMQTGQRLGLGGGRGGFAAGARLLYGDEVATQMMQQAESPGFWRGQRQIIAQRQREMSYDYRQQQLDAAPMFGGIPRDIAAATGITGGIRNIGRGFDSIGEAFSEAGAGVGGALGGIAENYRTWSAAREGIMHRKLSGGALEGVRRGARGGRSFGDIVDATRNARGPGSQRVTGVDIELSDMAMVNAANMRDKGSLGAVAGVVANVGSVLGLDLVGADVGAAVAGISTQVRYGSDPLEQRDMVRDYLRGAHSTIQMIDRAKAVGGREENVSMAASAIDKAAGKDLGGLGYDVLRTAGNKLDKVVYDRGKYGENVKPSDVQKLLVESIVESSGGKIGKKRARQIADKLSKNAGVMKDINAQITHYARQDSLDPSIWLKAQEEDPRTAIFDSITTATESRVDALRSSMETMEEKLDLDPFLGSYSSEEEKVQGIAAERGGKKFALLAAASLAVTGDRDEQSRKKLREVQKKYGFTGAEVRAAEREARALEGSDEDTLERIREAAGAGSVADLERYGSMQQQIGLQGAFASEGFLKQFAPYSKKLTGYMAGVEKSGASDVTAAGIAQQFTSEELEQMAKGGGGARRWAAVLKAAQGKGDKAKKAQELLTRFAASEAKAGEEGVEEATASKAEGEESQALERSDAAMGDMQAVFADFSPAVKEFSAGARMLREAMNSDMIRRMREE